MMKRLLDVVVAVFLSSPEPTFGEVVLRTMDVGEWTEEEATIRLAAAIAEGLVHATFDDEADCHLSITDAQRAFVQARWS